jgi:hypothetical protein
MEGDEETDGHNTGAIRKRGTFTGSGLGKHKWQGLPISLDIFVAL